jgi:hypothetical protein
MKLNKKRLDSFHEDIMKVVKKYPEFYIESWGPEEYIELCPDITLEECKILSSQLRNDFCPESGTNKDLIRSIVEIELKRGDKYEDL